MVNLLNQMFSTLKESKSSDFRVVLMKALRHLIASLNFRDAEVSEHHNTELTLIRSAVEPIYSYSKKVIDEKVFPAAGGGLANKKVNPNYWDKFLERSEYQHHLLLAIQITKVSDEQLYQDGLLRVMNWICLPQMLENRKTFEWGFRLLMELSTPELYKLQEFTHW